jgi:hypothetical protein
VGGNYQAYSAATTYRVGYPYRFDQSSAGLCVLINPYVEGGIATPSYIHPVITVIGALNYVSNPLGRGTFLRGGRIGHSLYLDGLPGSAATFQTHLHNNPNHSISWASDGGELSFNLNLHDCRHGGIDGGVQGVRGD